MPIRLVQIPGIEAQHQTMWQVRCLEVNGRNLVLSDLGVWSRSAVADYKKIMKVLRQVGQVDRIRNEKHVKKCANSNYGDVYEARADKGNARVMFFYSKNAHPVIICTNTYWKTKPSATEQDNAFALCARLKDFYEADE